MHAIVGRPEIVEQLAFLHEGLLAGGIFSELEQLLRADAIEKPAAQILLCAADEGDPEAAVPMHVAERKRARAILADCCTDAIDVETIGAE